MQKTIYQTLLLTIVTATFAFTASPATANGFSEADSESNYHKEIIISDSQTTEFALPGDAVPESGIGGGVRGNVPLPNSATPASTIGAAIRESQLEWDVLGDRTKKFTFLGNESEFALPGNDSEFALPGNESEFTLPGN